MKRPPHTPAAMALTLAVMVSACDSTAPRIPTSLSLEPQSVQMDWGRVASIVPVLLDQNGSPFGTWPAGYEMSWTVVDPAVARMAADNLRTGQVRAVWGGHTTLMAAAGPLVPVEVPIIIQSPPDTLTGAASFTYTGDRTGTVTIAGTWPADLREPGIVDSDDYLEDHRGMVSAVAGAGLGVSVRVLREDGLEDAISISFEGSVDGPGTYHAPQGGYLTLGRNRTQTSGAEIYSGAVEVTVTGVTPTRITGTFQMALRGGFGPGGAYTESVEVDGTFSAPRLPADG
jgi:hypothetical protein